MKKFTLLLLIVLTAMTLMACGGTKKEEAYRKAAKSFVQNVNKIGAEIDSLDATDPASGEALLDLLGQMNDEFRKFSKVEAPKKYKSCQAKSKDAYSHMNSALSLYQQLYHGAAYDSSIWQNAHDEYSTAMTAIRELGSDIMNKSN